MNAIKMKHEKNKNTSFDRKKIAEEILVNRINFILESNFGKDSINNTNLRKKIKTFVLVLEELNSSNDYGYTIETNNLEVILKNLYGGSFDSILSNISLLISKNVFKKVGIAGKMFDEAVNKFSQDNSRIIDSMRSCESMSHNMAQIIENVMIDDIRNSTSPDGNNNSFIKNHLIDSIQSNDNFLTSLKEKLKPIVCDIYNKFIDRAKRIESALKEPMV